MIEGKISNQLTRQILSNPRCEKCCKIIDQPTYANLTIKNEVFGIASYLRTEYFIYETKSGRSVVYCSDYCSRKHNHRFKK